MRLYSFEKLEVWNLSRELVKEIYSLTKKFPKEERFGLTNQMQRSAVSISANIAEGTSRITNKEKARFTEIAYGSLIETLNHLILAYDLNYIAKNELSRFRPKIEEISNKLNSLRKSYLK